MGITQLTSGVLDCQDEQFYGASIRSFFTLFKVLGGEETMPTEFETMELDDEEEEEEPRSKRGGLAKPPDNVRTFLNQYLESQREEQVAAETAAAQETTADVPARDKSPSAPSESEKVENVAIVNGDEAEKSKAGSADGETPRTTPPRPEAANGDHLANGKDRPAGEPERPLSPGAVQSPTKESKASSEQPPKEVRTPHPEKQDRKKKAKPMKILKLKDWPIEGDFETNYPDMYHDFSDALPVPDYTRRNGVMNLYSHVS